MATNVKTPFDYYNIKRLSKRKKYNLKFHGNKYKQL